MRANPGKAVLQAEIAAHLSQVQRLRAETAADPLLQARLAGLKRHQCARLAATYADLHAQPRYRKAVEFFINDLYTDRDFSQRDAYLYRIVPTLGRLFPAQALATLESALHLHALSERLDLQMARALPGGADWSEAEYQCAWAMVGEEPARREQLARVLEVGRSLDKLVGLPLIGTVLRTMAGPAAVAGLTALHGFLLRGYEAFVQMKGAREFLQIIDTREGALIDAFCASQAGVRL